MLTFRAQSLLVVLCLALAWPVAVHADVATATAPDGLYAVMETSLGTVVCKLHYDKAPITVANFVGLATGERAFKDPYSAKEVTRPFFDGLKFHRIIKDFMIQGGCPLGTGTGDPGYKFKDEFDASLRHDGPGVLSMANSGPATNGSQFFITHKATPWLDDRHTVFGKCVEGQDVVNAMAAVPMTGAQNSSPVEDIILNKVTIVRTGAAAEAFDWKGVWDGYEAEERQELEAKLAQEAEQLETLAAEVGFNVADLVDGPEGVRYVVVNEGTGDPPAQGDTVATHYTGWLMNGKVFDSSRQKGAPFNVRVGVGGVIRGWDVMLLEMRPGERRFMVIPSSAGYGARGHPAGIPGNSTLVFDMEILDQ